MHHVQPLQYDEIEQLPSAKQRRHLLAGVTHHYCPYLADHSKREERSGIINETSPFLKSLKSHQYSRHNQSGAVLVTALPKRVDNDTTFRVLDSVEVRGTKQSTLKKQRQARNPNQHTCSWGGFYCCDKERMRDAPSVMHFTEADNGKFLIFEDPVPLSSILLMKQHAEKQQFENIVSTEKSIDDTEHPNSLSNKENLDVSKIGNDTAGRITVEHSSSDNIIQLNGSTSLEPLVTKKRREIYNLSDQIGSLKEFDNDYQLKICKDTYRNVNHLRGGAQMAKYKQLQWKNQLIANDNDDFIKNQILKLKREVIISKEITKSYNVNSQSKARKSRLKEEVLNRRYQNGNRLKWESVYAARYMPYAGAVNRQIWTRAPMESGSEQLALNVIYHLLPELDEISDSCFISASEYWSLSDEAQFSIQAYEQGTSPSIPKALCTSDANCLSFSEFFELSPMTEESLDGMKYVIERGIKKNPNNCDETAEDMDSIEDDEDSDSEAGDCPLVMWTTDVRFECMEGLVVDKLRLEYWVADEIKDHHLCPYQLDSEGKIDPANLPHPLLEFAMRSESLDKLMRKKYDCQQDRNKLYNEMLSSNAIVIMLTRPLHKGILQKDDELLSAAVS